MEANNSRNTPNQEDLYMIFKCGIHRYAITFSVVDGIVQSEKVKRAERPEKAFRGSVYYQEKDVPVIDVRFVLEGVEIPLEEETPIIMVRIGDRNYGLLIEEATEVLHGTSLRPAGGEDFWERIDQTKICGVLEQGNHTMLVLDPDSIL